MKGEFYGISKEDEVAKLKEVREIAEEKLSSIRNDVSALQQELNDIREVYDLDEKEGLAMWFNADARFNEVRKELLKAQRAGRKPYFGRIDFVDIDADTKETFYIGKTVIARDITKPIVIDWRAPVSSAYYEQKLGLCKYRVPHIGKWTVDLKRKRTYEIEGDELKDFFDTEVVANDELLTKYLSKNKKNVLSEIIATIQQEQNEVIRKSPLHNVLIQGSAGSGKTTVAMHRISYILYNFEKQFPAKDFYIIGSNKVLLNYITGVLPDLDVYDVKQLTMDELFTTLLYEEWLPQTMKVRQTEKTDISVSVKGTSKWFSALERFATSKLRSILPNEDVVLKDEGDQIMKKSEIEEVFRKYRTSTLVDLVEKLTDRLESRVETFVYSNKHRFLPEEQKKIFGYFKKYFNRIKCKQSVTELYEEFLFLMKDTTEFSYLPGEFDLYDLSSMAYLYKRLIEEKVIREAAHVVIDEAQDFGIAIYQSIKYCLTKCTYTIMGDVSQNINFGCGLEDWEELKKLMLPNKFDYFGLLRKSYRNTIEISDFAMDILRHGSFPIYPVEPIVRHGEKVAINRASNDENLANGIASSIRELHQEGFETIAVICADQKQTLEMSKRLSKTVDVRIFSEENCEFDSGVTVLPIEYSKGLEFDAVIIADASSEYYPKEDSYAKLLYVASTRALHELRVFYTGELTGLIKDPIPENRKNISFAEDDFHVAPRVFEEDDRTKEQMAFEQAREGDKELSEREKYGPRRIVVNSSKEKEGDSATKVAPKAVTASAKTIIKSNPEKEEKKDSGISEFGSMPNGTSLLGIGKGKIDNGIKWVKGSDNAVIMTTGCGCLKIVPISDDSVRVIFAGEGQGDYPYEQGVFDASRIVEKPKYSVRDGRDKIEILMNKLSVLVEKRTGIVTFVSANGKQYLTEKSDTRRIDSKGNVNNCYEYFDFSKREILKAFGEKEEEWIDVTGSVRYISHRLLCSDRADFGEMKKGTETVLMSMKGYQLVFPGNVGILVSHISDPYVKFENTNSIDFVFRGCN